MLTAPEVILLDRDDTIIDYTTGEKPCAELARQEAASRGLAVTARQFLKAIDWQMRRRWSDPVWARRSTGGGQTRAVSHAPSSKRLWRRWALMTPKLWTASPSAIAGLDSTKAVAAGLRLRSLSETVRDTLAWDCARPGGLERRAGLAADREAELRRLWQGAQGRQE